MAVYKEIHFLLFFFKNVVIFYKIVDPFAMRVNGHKGVKTKPQYSFFNLISKSSNKAKKRLVNAYAVGCNFYAGFCRILLSLPVYYAGLCFQFCRFSILALLSIFKLLLLLF